MGVMGMGQDTGVARWGRADEGGAWQEWGPDGVGPTNEKAKVEVGQARWSMGSDRNRD